jgi:glutathione-specific gamma-glutamylcyclotransferase
MGAAHHSMWIFGYGSLLWRPDFAFLERRPGQILGYVRRFYQGSPDHRGTPEAPGRVVTLVEEPGALCVGAAYRVSSEETARILSALDQREQGGYQRRWCPVSPLDGGASFSALVYFAGPDNPHFLGPAPREDMARHILAARGPSGANLDYLLRLDESLRALSAPDPHFSALCACVRALSSVPRASPGGC